MLRPALAALAALVPLDAFAQEAGGNLLAFTLRGGVEARPGYFGSDEVAVAPDLAFDLGAVRLGRLAFGDPDFDALERGFGLRGSFRYLPERSVDDDDELAGLEGVEAAIEIGAGVRYVESWWGAFADVRYGVTGHDSLVADIGMDLIARPTDRLTLRAGPRVFVGSDDYAATYFGVTEAEEGPSAFPAYEAEGGVLSGGVEVGAEYRLGGAWGIEAGVRYDRLRNDAARSPISEEDDQVSGFVGVTRRFAFEF